MPSNKNKSQKRSPLKQRNLPQAGDSTYGRLLNLLTNEPVLWILTCCMFASAAWVQWIAWWEGKPTAPHAMTVLTAALIVGAVIRVRKTLREVDRIGLGLRGERAVGQLLEKLRTRGYSVYHDIEGDGFNVDHVLIGPGGVFVIETKTISKPAKGESSITYDGERILVNGMTPDRDPVKQVRACRDHIRGILENATGKKPKMRAVVLYPGWWVEKQPKGVEVWVLNPEALPAFLDYEPQALPETDVSLFASALETHVRASA